MVPTTFYPLMNNENLLTLGSVTDANPGEKKNSSGVRQAKRKARLLRFAQQHTAGKWKQNRKQEDRIKKYADQHAAGKWKQRKKLQ